MQGQNTCEGGEKEYTEKSQSMEMGNKPCQLPSIPSFTTNSA